MNRPYVPTEVLDLAHARAAARAERDFGRADELRAAIEDAGWTVVDRGTDFDLRPAHPPDVVAESVVRYGSSASVPSRLAEPDTASASVVIVASDWPADVARAVRGLRAHSPADTQVVVVADDPSPDQEAALADLEAAGAEVVRTSDRLGQASALNIGLRRSVGAVVVFLDASVEPTGDVTGPLVAALADPSVAVAGGWGLASSDLRHFDEATVGPVDAVEGYCLAFRRSEGAVRGPLDEHFRFYRNLDIWWSFGLRDEGEDEPPRRAVTVDLPAIRHEHRAWDATDPAERDRLSKRNFYRLLDRFRGRDDLIRGGRPPD